MVLITVEGLRIDLVGGLGGETGLTPHLDQLIAHADWAGRAVAASSWVAPATASLLSGLPPHQHQVLHPEQARLPTEIQTLAEALGERGYRTTAWTNGGWISAAQGFDQGFDTFRPLRRGGQALAHLRGLNGQPELVFIHLNNPSPPWVRRDWMLPSASPGDLPQRLTRGDLEDLLGSGAAVEDAAGTLYRQNVAWADEQVGRYLAALEASGHGAETLVVVTSTHGLGLGGTEPRADGSDLHRMQLEVPLVIRLPAGSGRRFAVEPPQRVASTRLWATLVEAAGGSAPPGIPPSLFARDVSPVLSELYQPGDRNLFSLVSGDHQLLWEVALAPPAELGGQSPEALQRFAATRPFTGRRWPGGEPAPVKSALWRWSGLSASQPIEEPDVALELARRLAEQWGRFVEEEAPPGLSSRLWPAARHERPAERPPGGILRPPLEVTGP
jgi:hypothetical protein